MLRSITIDLESEVAMLKCIDIQGEGGMSMRKVLLVLLMVLVLAGNLFAAGAKESDDTVKIGVSFADFATERWPREAEMMTELAKERGAELIYQVANHDPKLQNDQIENMILQGVDVIIIIAQDGSAAVTAVEEAEKSGVKTIAYDRLIPSNKLSAYLTFDNVEIGRAQARGILKVKDSGNFMLLGGSLDDNCAVLVREGQMEVLQPYIDKGQIKVVVDQWVQNWDPAEATKIMENALTAQQNRIDAVVSSNDGTALGALQALEAQGLGGIVPLSGQDATAAGCQSIVDGGLTMTVFNDVRLLAPMAVDLAIDLVQNGAMVKELKEYSLYELTVDETYRNAGNVGCYFIPVVEIDKSNVYEEIVVSGYQPYDEVYRNVPVADRPPRP